MQGSEPSEYEDTGESGETYDVEKISENIRRQQRHSDDKEAVPEMRSDADSVA